MAGNPGFLGMRGTGDWAENQRPQNWREMILYLYPNGSAPLTAILSKLREEKVDDPIFHWWTKLLPSQAGTVTAGEAYLNVNNSGDVVAKGTAAGITIYFKMSASDLTHFRVGHQVLCRDASQYDVDFNGLVTSVNTAQTNIGVKLIEADDNSAGAYGAHTVDRVLIVGNANAEGANMPDAISYDPTEWSNYTEIFRTSLSITRTARLTRLRTGDAYREAKRECLELHSIEMEKAFLWGFKWSGTGDNGKPKRTTMGLVRAIQSGDLDGTNTGVINSFKVNDDFSGDTWLQTGKDWLDYYLEQMFRYGKSEKLAFCGSGALLGLNQLAETYGTIQITPKTKAYGLAVNEWITPFGTLDLVTHPLFSFEATNRHSMVIFEPAGLRYRYVSDTVFMSEKSEQQNTGWTRRDGTDEEYLTEAGLEYHHPNGWGYLNGVGEDNEV